MEWHPLLVPVFLVRSVTMPLLDTSMQGKICLITGANSGIGKATALGLAQMGATVVMVCRDRARGEEAQREIKMKSGNGLSLVFARIETMCQITRDTRYNSA